MTTLEDRTTTTPPPEPPRPGEPGSMTIAEIVEAVTQAPLPVRFTAYDGSATGAVEASVTVHVKNPRGVSYVATAPGDLGLARAYVAGDLDLIGVHPGDPYEALVALEGLSFRRPSARRALEIARSLGLKGLTPPPPPPQETMPRWRRVAEGLRHSKTRDADAIHHHYDVSNRFYEQVLGPSMTYTCACYPQASASLEEAQVNKYRLVFDKLARLRLGWHGPVCRAPRRPGARRHAVQGAGGVGPAVDPRGGARGVRRGPAR
jgi:cyclopropane-fatty-acyl-phospholipid synthase